MTALPMPSPASSQPSPRADANELAALAEALAGEHAAVYAYGVVGAQAGRSHRRAAADRLVAHGLQRDLLAAQLSTAGATPPPAAEPAYALPFEVRTVADARRLAAHVELAVAATYADLVAASAPPRRSQAARWLAQCAVAAHHWGGPPHAFPGLPERA